MRQLAEAEHSLLAFYRGQTTQRPALRDLF